ncbi:MAG: nucleotide exchange factor GrpE [Deltaproteobacteria bacterium]|nr:nucleotide exchange factor GrpE [Deltaproteobacteria bacterium]
MVRKPYNNPYSNDPFDDGVSPVIDPAAVYQADPEINFDNVKQAPGLDQPDAAPAAQGGREPDNAVLEKLRRARPESETANPAADGQGQRSPDPGQCPHCAEAEKARLMALADLENARKRLAREKEDFVKFAGESIVADILPALDNLDLALAYAPEGKECQNFVVGVDMTRKLLLDALSRHGLEEVGELGEPFDPAKHEAVEMLPHPDYETGQVCGLMNKGYRLKDRLIRPAKVKVCKNG